MSPNIDRRKSILRNGQGTVHPENGDIEAGVNRVKFSITSPIDENAARKMVRSYFITSTQSSDT
jgi:hypothetical protein